MIISIRRRISTNKPHASSCIYSFCYRVAIHRRRCTAHIKDMHKKRGRMMKKPYFNVFLNLSYLHLDDASFRSSLCLLTHIWTPRSVNSLRLKSSVYGLCLGSSSSGHRLMENLHKTHGQISHKGIESKITLHRTTRLTCCLSSSIWWTVQPTRDLLVQLPDVAFKTLTGCQRAYHIRVTPCPYDLNPFAQPPNLIVLSFAFVFSIGVN